MAKIFDVQDELHENPNRNSFDKTHKRHVTGKFGYIYPYLCQPVSPTCGWKFNTAIGANLMPMWYPTQSNMRFIVHNFYVPYRLLQKDWKNMLEGLVDVEMPYLDKPASFYKTGSLADHLGLPTNYIVPSDNDYRFPVPITNDYTGYHLLFSGLTPGSSFVAQHCSGDSGFATLYSGHVNFLLCREPLVPFAEISHVGSGIKSCVLTLGRTFLAPSSKKVKVRLLLYVSNTYDQGLIDAFNNNDISSLGPYLEYLTSFDLGNLSDTTATLNFSLSSEQVASVNSAISEFKYVFAALGFENLEESTLALTIGAGRWVFSYSVASGTDISISEHASYCPYYSDTYSNTNDTEKIRSYAFRAYEMIYNSFYRNQQGVQPFVVNGETKYNEYLTTDGNGADTTNYELKCRNWELDAYTSCLPSPQQGDAPIIAVDTEGTLRVSHDDGRVSVARLRDVDGFVGVEVTDADIDPDHPEDARTVVRLSSSGMTIADFRQGNALQRFLEQSLRSGFRYADFIFGHFGKSPSHQELDMPIFLGGFTQVVDTNKISNVAAGSAPLGDFAGTGASFGAGKHEIKHYFDDYGLVIGVMMLVPDAAYSQVVPKHFLYNSRLDFFFPQFANLGLQPVTYEELCPIQSHAEYVNGDTSKKLTDVFGYQRPNHDLIWIPDTCHGLFRTSLAGSVINRRFGSRPILGDDFLKIKPEECNDIFSVTEKDDDVWIAQVITKIETIEPYPRIVIPSLGR